jgi:lipopolysaccharide/colanic/teichoic acid biosynthesis glycosyltransferase
MSLSSPYSRFAKRSFDIAASLAGLLLLTIPCALLALLVKLSSKGPVFYCQQRVGRHGKTFTCVKFRTMYVGAERAGSITSAGDRRITPVGRLLRRFKLDEFPQLWNVLIGRMSFVGPRPDVPGYADTLQGDARRILDLRPGITGPATLHFRNEEELLASVEDPRRYNDEVIWPKKVELNLRYLDEWGFWKDIGYIFATILPWLGKGQRG